MKTYKRILAVILCVVMTLTAAPLSGFVGLELPSLFDFEVEAASYSGKCGDNLTWSLDTSTGVLNITGTGAMKNYTSSSYVPWGSYRSYIKIVNIGNSVTTIGDYAFGDCTSLTSVTIGNSVTTIGDYAFGYCYSLTSVTIPDSVTTIGYGAFYDCYSLTSVTIPDSVTSIGGYAFCSCDSLTSITVDPDNAYYSSDEYGVLFNKDKTTLIQYPIGNTRVNYTIPDSVTGIGDSAFRYCTSLTSVTIGNSVTTIGDRAFYDCYSLTSVTIPDSVTTIGYRAFETCYSLTSVTIPDSVTTIGDRAFYYCNNLTSVTIPDSVTTIGKEAFYDCTSLTSIKVDADNKYYSSDSYGVLFNKDKTKLIQYPIGNTRTSYLVPDSVITIGNSAFYSCDSLTSITIPDSVTTIGDSAFFYCDSLTSVTIPDSVTSIGDWAFYGCDSLTDVYYTGTEAQWNKISIGSNNTPLTSATIHYSYVIPSKFIYSQSHVVSNYKDANADYAAKYFAGAAQPMDGSNGTPDLCIPGLSLGDNMVPQGIAYYPAKNWMLVSSYYKDGDTDSYPCYIFALDFATGKMVAEYKLKEAESSTLHGHVGGIAVSNHNLYVTTDDSCIGYAPLSDLDKMNGEIIIREHTSMSEWLGNANTAYLSINDGILITGNFFYAKDSKYDTPAKAANSVILMQRLNGNSSVDEWNSVCNPAVTAVIKVPDSIDRIQGAVYRDKKFYISSSFGRKNESKLYVADLSGSTLKNISEFKALPMMEGITFVGDYIYSVHESASAFYLNGLDGKGKSTKPTDVVWRIAYKELVYNMYDETYSFGNYVDGDSEIGHCFGMSMTSAGYFLNILDINAIGGNKQDGVYALPETSKVKEPICYYQNIQGKYADNAIVAGGWYDKNHFHVISYDWNSIVNYVDNHKHDNKGALVISFGKKGEGNHAINFLRYEVVNGQERIYAYDNNYPDIEVYFYKDENGDILQVPKTVFSGAIDRMSLISVEKYFNSLGDYDATRYIFADKGAVFIAGAIEYPMACGNRERVVFEIPEGEEKVVIVPLVENAEFEYLNVTYNFDQAEAGQAGEFTLAQDETVPEETVELTFIDFPQNIEIKTPSTTTVNYGDTLILHADFGEVALPDGYSIVWTVEGTGFNMSPAEDGLTCKMTSVANGNATIKATLVDENGEAVLDADGNEMSDSKQLTSKAGFFQKIISFFKNLFRMSRIILQSFDN